MLGMYNQRTWILLLGTMLTYYWEQTARKRKRDDEDVELKKSYGIVTDARDWYFLRCEKGGDGRIRYSLSDPLIVELGKEVNSDHVKTCWSALFDYWAK